MRAITVRLPESLSDQMDEYPEVNWSEVGRQALRTRLDEIRTLELINDLFASDQPASPRDVAQLVDLVGEDMGDQLRQEFADRS